MPSYVNRVAYQAWNLLPQRVTFFCNKSAKITQIIATEAYSVFRYVLPASLTWCYRKYISSEIETIALQVKINKVTKVAYLNIHGKNSLIKKGQGTRPVLLVHGDFGHPYTMLKLADIAQKQKVATFSLYLPGELNNQQFELHQQILKQAVDKIESIVQTKQAIFKGLSGAGHSSGAILLAERQFVALDSRIKATFAIAGRLNISDETECSDGILKDKIKAIYQGISKHPELPLKQIVPDKDWVVPQLSMQVRLKDMVMVPGMHLSVLFAKKTEENFLGFLKEMGT